MRRKKKRNHSDNEDKSVEGSCDALWRTKTDRQNAQRLDCGQRTGTWCVWRRLGLSLIAKRQRYCRRQTFYFWSRASVSSLWSRSLWRASAAASDAGGRQRSLSNKAHRSKWIRQSQQANLTNRLKKEKLRDKTKRDRRNDILSSGNRLLQDVDIWTYANWEMRHHHSYCSLN